MGGVESGVDIGLDEPEDGLKTVGLSAKEPSEELEGPDGPVVTGGLSKGEEGSLVGPEGKEGPDVDGLAEAGPAEVGLWAGKKGMVTG